MGNTRPSFSFFLRLLGITFFLCQSSTALAVQKSDNLNKTVEMLRVELDALQRNTPVDIVKYKKERVDYFASLKSIEDKIDEFSIVMYSQRSHSIFSMAYTCKQIQDVYQEFTGEQFPLETWKRTIDGEITRYHKLHAALGAINDSLLADHARSAKETAVLTCDSIISLFIEVKSLIATDEKVFLRVSEKIETLESYTLSQYDWLRNRIFLDGSTSYIDMLQDWGEHYRLFVDGMDQMFSFYRENREVSFLNQFLHLSKVSLCLLALSLVVAYALVCWGIPRRWKHRETRKRKNYLIASWTLLVFMIALFAYQVNVFKSDYLSHASILILEYAFSFFLVLMSLTLRLPSARLSHTFKLYLPMLCLGFLPILFRILVVQNAVVHFLFPPLLLLATLIYIPVLIKYGKKASRTDTFYSWFSFTIILFCTVLSWYGYRYMSLQILMLWLTLLCVIQVLVTFRFFISRWDKRYMRKTHSTSLPWHSHLLNSLLMPVLSMISILAGFLWAAHVFDLGDFFREAIKLNFLEIPKVVSLSVENIVWLVCLGVIVNYGIFITKEILRSIFGDRYETGSIPVFVSIGTILTWGIYVSSAMIVLQVDYSGIMVVMGGFSMGIGFAMKETIENFICGMSLMMGRVRLGDTIECDGIRGKVSSIGYRSTLLETLDGSIIAFQNNQLFAKTFKNLTRNHGFELAKISVGVAYGTDVEKARQLILTEVHKSHHLQPGQSVAVFLDGFGASSVDLIVILWLPVNGKGSVMSAIREGIYRSFAENDISIPFPQQDIYLHEAGK